VLTSLWNNPPIPVFKLSLKSHFPEQSFQNFALTVHPDRNSFLVSDGWTVSHLELPDGFDDCSAYVDLLIMRSEQLIRSFSKKLLSDQKTRISTTNLNESNNNRPVEKRVSKLRKIFKSFRRKSSSQLQQSNCDMFQVDFEEILSANQNQIRDDDIDLSHIFLKALESLRALVFFVFTLSCQRSTRRSFQKVVKLVSNRFRKLIFRCPETVASRDLISLATNWMSDVVKMSGLDSENIFTNSLVGLLTSALQALIKVLPKEESHRSITLTVMIGKENFNKQFEKTHIEFKL
jgi:hypothetical protein